MYSPHLDTPPPQSQFRRPWSPDPYDPLPSAHYSSRPNLDRQTSRFLNQEPLHYDYGMYQSSGRGYGQRREPSDVSVEALDLADYARTLPQTRNIPQDQYYYAHDMYPPPSSPPHRPQSRDSMIPPSLTSHGETLSSNSHSTRTGYPRRPFSLPPQPTSSRRTTSPLSAVSHRYPAFGDPRFSSSPQIHTVNDPEIDISQFPAWSRTWYNANSNSQPDDIYTALPKSQFDSKRSPFDPGYKHRSGEFDPYSSYGGTTFGGHDSSRDVLPWSNDPPEYGPSIDSTLKEERMRMLEREFGPKAKSGRTDDGFLDEDGKPRIGTVDSKGQLVTQGPRKRLTVRVFQIILAFAAAVPGIYAALAIKPKGKPPPSGTMAAYVLYVVSVITLVGLIGLFVIRPCCCGRRQKSADPSNPLSNGMMVLPMQGLPGGKKAKKAKGGKKGKKGQPAMGDVQVNLIVDPTIFNGGQRDAESDEDAGEDDWNGSVPGEFDSKRRRRRNAPRRSIFAGLAMEEQWKFARSWLKKITAVDVVGGIIWGAVFILILLGQRCPIGQFEGWCTAYNTSTAAACLLSLTFFIHIFFDVKDLHTSKASPRTRT